MEGGDDDGSVWQVVTQLPLRRWDFSLAPPPPPPVLRCLSEALGLDAVATAPISNPAPAYGWYITTGISVRHVAFWAREFGQGRCDCVVVCLRALPGGAEFSVRQVRQRHEEALCLQILSTIDEALRKYKAIFSRLQAKVIHAKYAGLRRGQICSVSQSFCSLAPSSTAPKTRLE